MRAVSLVSSSRAVSRVVYWLRSGTRKRLLSAVNWLPVNHRGRLVGCGWPRPGRRCRRSCQRTWSQSPPSQSPPGSPTSARFCWIRAARLARWLVQARGEGLPIVSRLGQQFLGPFGVVGALPCRPGVLRARQDAGVGHRTQEPVFCWHSSSLSRAFSMAWRRSGAVHRLVVDHQFIEGAGHRPLLHGEAGLLRHGAVLFGDATTEGVVVRSPAMRAVRRFALSPSR